MNRLLQKYNETVKPSLIKEFGYTQENLAKETGMTKVTMNLKLNNKANFTQLEIEKIRKNLHITCDEIGVYFFTPKV